MSRYISYFGRREAPFSLTPTSRLFDSNPVYEEAYTRLLAGVRQRAGFMLLAEEVGAGKTTLLRRLLNRLLEEPAFSVVSSHDYPLSFEELLSSVCRELGVETRVEGPSHERAAVPDFLLAPALAAPPCSCWMRRTSATKRCLKTYL